MLTGTYRLRTVRAWSHSSDSPTENFWEVMSVHSPRGLGGWEECDCSQSDVNVRRFDFTLSFYPAQNNLLYWNPDCVSYRLRTQVGAKFCLIWHFLSKPEMFLSSALLLLVTHFTIAVCWRYLGLTDSVKEQPAKDAAFAWCPVGPAFRSKWLLGLAASSSFWAGILKITLSTLAYPVLLIHEIHPLY